MILPYFNNEPAIPKQTVIYNLLKDNGDILFTTDVHFNIDNWNSGAAETFNLEADEIIGKNIFTVQEITLLLHWKVEENEVAHIRKILSDTGHYTNEIVTKNNYMQDTIWSVSITSAINNNGFKDGYVYYIKDKSLTQRIEKLSIKIFKLLENSSDVCIALDKHFHIINWNKAAAKIYGYTEAEVIGKPIEILKAPISINKRELIREHIKIAGEWNGELQYFSKKGTEIILSFKITASYDTNNEIEDIICIGRDITDQKKNEQKLKENNELLESKIHEQDKALKTVYERVSDGFIAFDTNWNYVYINERALNYNNKKSPDELLGKKIWTEFPNVKNTDRGRTYLESMKNQEKMQVTEFNERLNMWVEFTCYPSPNGLSVFAKDITEKKKVELKLQDFNTQLRNLTARLHRVKEEERVSIAREIHDELGQQLTAIKFDTYLIKKSIPNSKEETLDKINIVLSEIDHAIDSVRKISKNLRPILLEETGLINALHSYGKDFEKKTGIKFMFVSSSNEVESKNPLTSITLFRIFQESLTNITRHAEASSVYCRIELNDNNIELSITDNGKGFSIEEQSSKKTLGLLGMKERALMLGGNLIIESIVGQGTKVFVSIPLNDLAAN